jgi:hypothetical protein
MQAAAETHAMNVQAAAEARVAELQVCVAGPTSVGKNWNGYEYHFLVPFYVDFETEYFVSLGGMVMSACCDPVLRNSFVLGTSMLQLTTHEVAFALVQTAADTRVVQRLSQSALCHASNGILLKD